MDLSSYQCHNQISFLPIICYLILLLFGIQFASYKLVFIKLKIQSMSTNEWTSLICLLCFTPIPELACLCLDCSDVKTISMTGPVFDGLLIIGLIVLN